LVRPGSLALQEDGRDEADPISNPLVTRAIRGAQVKIETQVPKDLQTESIEDWFRYNLKEEWK
jgi:hypothetical protein